MKPFAVAQSALEGVNSGRKKGLSLVAECVAFRIRFKAIEISPPAASYLGEAQLKGASFPLIFFFPLYACPIIKLSPKEM